MNVIAVDDEPMLLEALKDAVTQVLPEAELHCFSRAREALQYGMEHPVDIAFLDISMPVIDGMDMAKALRQWYPRSNIVFCTGYMEYAADALAMQCSSYLMKPISVRKVQEAVAHLRFPVGKPTARIRIQCFGCFEVYCNEQPVRFRYQKSKELLAILVDRNGAACTRQEVSGLLFPNQEHSSYMNQLRRDLLDTFKALGAVDVLRSTRGSLAVNRSAVECDYFDCRDHKIPMSILPYMEQYDFPKYY